MGSTRSYEIAKFLGDNACEVDLLTSNRTERDIGRAVGPDCEPGIVRIHAQKIPYNNAFGFARRLLAFSTFSLWCLFKGIKIRPDIIYASSTPLTIGIPAVILARLKKIPLVFEVRDLWPEMPIAMGALNGRASRTLAYSLRNWIYKNSSAIIALSPDMKDGVVKAGFTENRVAVIPNGATLFDRADSVAINDSPVNSNRILIYTGTVGRVNNIEYLVDLASELKKIHSNVIIHIVGDGGRLEKVVDYAKKLDVLNKYIYFFPPVPKDELNKRMRKAKMACNIVVDKREAFANSANKFFDALGLGIPVLINHGGWMHSLIKKHRVGISTWGLSMKEAASLVNLKLNDDLWLQSASANAVRLSELNFEWCKLGADVLGVLDLTLKGYPELVSKIGLNLKDEKSF